MKPLGIFLDKNGKEKKPKLPEEHGLWDLEAEDFLLYALLCDNVYAPELLWEDPVNREYSGCYRVRDYQYPLFRVQSNYAGFACARSTGKTESLKAKSFTHAFRRTGEDRLLSAPELIHLLPLTDAIESRINSTRLTREFLDTRSGKTGFTHRPFGVNYADGTALIARIPRLDGRGVKGMHAPDVTIDEAQNYPEKGWIEIHEPLPLDTQVLTPCGYKLMADVQVGDEVVGIDGQPTRVEGVYPQGEREVLRVHLSDGAIVECDEEHYWTVGVPATIVHGRWQHRTTAQIEEDLQKSGRRCGSGRQPWHVRTPEPIHFNVEPDLPVDPYILGLLLGDGCLRENSVRFSSGDIELVQALSEALSSEEELRFAGGCDWWLRKRDGGVHARPPLMDALDGLGLLGRKAHQKSIPPRYRWASVTDRLALLQGLVDSDGNIDVYGAIRYVTTSPQLAADFRWLVRTLGGRCSTSEGGGGRYLRSYVVRARLPDRMSPGRLERKAKRARNGNVSRMNRRIVRVERMGTRKPMQCIQVAHPAHLFLVTEALVPSNNTVMKDHVDQDGRPDFIYEFYGVHSGARDTGFYKRTTSGGFKVIQITALQRPGWSAAEKEAAKAAYGGTSSPDYRRNILGEPGAAASPLFVSARLVACMDQNRESTYNKLGYHFQELRVEEFDELMLPISDVLDLPSGLKRVWVGMDIGLTISPTVILIFSEETIERRPRLKLVRRIHLQRFSSPQIRAAVYAVGHHFGEALQGFGIDSTGLGLPIFQDIQAGEDVPPVILERAKGYFFNAKVPVGVAREHVTKDSLGNLRDQYGAAVVEVTIPLTGETRYVVHMPMIEASTKYLREFVDTTYLLLPFDPAVIGDMQGDTAQRLKRIVGLKNKPNAYHILDAMRAMSMKFKDADVMAELELGRQVPVLDMALDEFA